MKRAPRYYIALSEVNMDFTFREVEKFDAFMNAGCSLPEAAKALRRTELEILILYLDRIMLRKIKPIYSLRRIQNRKEDESEHTESKTIDHARGSLPSRSSHDIHK